MFKTLISAVFLAAFSMPAAAQQPYPTKPIRLIVPFPAGGTTDIFARLLAESLTSALGQQTIVENRPGAGGNIGADAVAKAEADGHTLVMGTVGTHAINVSLYARMPFDPVKDFAPIAFVAGVPNVMVVPPARVQAKTPAEFVALAKSKPGALSMASAGSGTSIHLSGELFKQTTGTDMVHVPYKGSAPALTDLIGGQVDVMFDNLPSSIGHIRAGTLRALAVTSSKRSPAFPDLPTLSETVAPGLEASSWFGLFAPAATSRDVIDRLNREVLKALETDAAKRRFIDLGAEARPYAPAEFGSFIVGEIAKWKTVVQASGAKAE